MRNLFLSVILLTLTPNLAMAQELECTDSVDQGVITVATDLVSPDLITVTFQNKGILLSSIHGTILFRAKKGTSVTLSKEVSDDIHSVYSDGKKPELILTIDQIENTVSLSSISEMDVSGTSSGTRTYLCK